MKENTIVSIIEVGLMADPGPIYRQAGYRPQTFGSLRKALASLRTLRPSVVACEFIYLPTYSMRISNLEPLIAAMELYCPTAGLLIYVDVEHLGQTGRLDFKGLQRQLVQVPASAATILDALKQLGQADR